MLIAGVIFTLRCCKLREVVEATKLLGLEIAESRIKQFIFCLKLVGWVRIVKRDVQYHIYVAGRAPIVFRGPGGISDFARFDPVRVRYDILQFYEKDDPRLMVLDSAII